MQYSKNYLSKVILKVDLIEPLNTNIEVFNRFKLIVSSNYSDLELKTNSIQNINANLSEGKPSISIKNEGLAANYSFNKNENEFLIDPFSISLGTSKYTSFKQFFDDFLLCFNTLNTLSELKTYKRIGLRYINIVRDPHVKSISEWSGFINQEFLPNYTNVTNSKDFKLRRNMIEYFFGDGDYLTRLYIGLWNPDFPSIITKNDFVIDIDCSIDLSLMSEDIKTRPHKMNDIAYHFFDIVTTEQFKATLKGDQK